MQKKESNYIGQIELLQRQNETFLMENGVLSKKTEGQAKINSAPSDLNLPELLKEYSKIILGKFDSVKQRLWSTEELAFNSSTGKRSEMS